MTEPLKIYGCSFCEIEFKGDKAAQAHYDEFKAKGDAGHVSNLVRVVGVPMKPITKKPEFTNLEKKD